MDLRLGRGTPPESHKGIVIKLIRIATQDLFPFTKRLETGFLACADADVVVGELTLVVDVTAHKALVSEM